MTSTFHCALCGNPAESHFCGSKKKRPTQEELAPLVAEYEAGASMRAMADKYGVGYNLLRRRLIWGGATIRNSYPRTSRG